MKKNQISNIKINNNNSINNNHYRNNSKGETHSKRGNFHINLNDPNFLDYNYITFTDFARYFRKEFLLYWATLLTLMSSYVLDYHQLAL